MISTVKREIAIEKELRSKIEWACTFSNCEPKIKNGNLRMVKKTNIAYVEPHRVIIKNNLYLFFFNFSIIISPLIFPIFFVQTPILYCFCNVIFFYVLTII